MNERVPRTPTSTSQGNNLAALMGNNQQQVYGINNYVASSAERVVIVGNNNTVGERAQNITILNSSGCIVAGGVVNVSIMNSSGVTVVDSNVTYQNNVQTSSSLNPISGVYTPTVSLPVNLDSMPVAQEGQWMRVGNVCTVSGSVSVNPTSTATYTSFDLSTPIPSAFTKPSECGGVAFADDIASMGAAIAADVADRVLFGWVSTDTTTKTMRYSFTFKIV